MEANSLFFARPEDVIHFRAQPHTYVLLLGGFNGNWNFGDLMQLLSTIRWYRQQLPEARIFPMLNLRLTGTLNDIDILDRLFAPDGWIFYSEGLDPSVREQKVYALGLAPLRPTQAASRAVLHLYGGGYLNVYWGHRILRVLEAVHDRFRPGATFWSGQQVDARLAPVLAQVLERWPPALVGCRDWASVHVLERSGVPALFSSDDSLEEMLRVAKSLDGDVGVGVEQGTFGLHLNLAPYAHVEPTEEGLLPPDWEATARSNVATVLEAVRSHYEGAAVPLLVGANLDPQAPPPESWAALLKVLVPRHFPTFVGMDLVGLLVHERLWEGAAALAKVDRVISHSYHVALLSAVLGTPVYLVANNRYYRQKRRGLGWRDLSLDEFLRCERGVLIEEQRGALQRQLQARESWLSRLSEALQRHLGRGERREDTYAGARSNEKAVQDRDLARGSVIKVMDQAAANSKTLRWWVIRTGRAVLAGPRHWGRLFRRLGAKARSGKLAPGLRRRWDGWLVKRSVSRETLSEDAPWDPTRPLVSVVIPCYNYGQYLEEAVRSVLRQTFQDFEIVVVDDGSDEPATLEVLSRLSHPRLRLLRQPNRGLPAARNAGIRQAQGKYVCCLDADDLLAPTYLEKAVHLLECFPTVGFAYSWVERFGDEGGIWETQPFNLANLLDYNHVSVAAVFRRSAWARVGGYWEAMRPGFEDWEFWVRLGACGYPGRLIPEPLLLYRKHGATMVHAAIAQREALMRKIRKRHARLYRNPDLVAWLQQTMDEQPLAKAPLQNLTRPDQYRAKEEGGRRTAIIIGGGYGEKAKGVLVEILRAACASDGEEVTFLTTMAGPAVRQWDLEALSPFTYHLPHFLPPELWEAYLVNFALTRQVDRLVCFGSLLALAVQVKEGLQTQGVSIPLTVVATDAMRDRRTRELLAASRAEEWWVLKAQDRAWLEHHGVAPTRIRLLSRSSRPGAGES